MTSLEYLFPPNTPPPPPNPSLDHPFHVSLPQWLIGFNILGALAHAPELLLTLLQFAAILLHFAARFLLILD